MKKKILSVIIMALCMLCVFALASCGKKDERISCPADNCDGALEEKFDDLYVCDGNIGHNYRICINEECKAPIENLQAEFCSSCGTMQRQCPECADNEINGVYCTVCGRQVQKNTSIGEIFGKTWSDREKAISDSALIMCFGMLGIFIVTGVIITFILVLNTSVEKFNQKKNNK